MKLCVECNTHYKEAGEECPADGTKLVEVGNDPMLGKTIGDRYRILHVIGKGSMGIVYKALQLSTGREMAVKFLLQNIGSAEPNESIIKRFQREAKTLGSLKHPNIVSLFDFGFLDSNQPYLVTEFLYGLTLTQLLKQNGHLEPRKALAVFRQVCDAVSEAHHHKVIHRDVKPDNIFLQGRDSGGRFVKVLDFGIAKLVDTRATTSLTLDGRVCGSPAYMSPEQCKGLEADYRCDIYSLAAVIFETLTGRRLFAGDDAMSVMFAHVNEPAPKLNSVRVDPAFTPQLESVMQRALSKEPGSRQRSVHEFFEELFDALHAEPARKPVVVQQNQNPGWIPFDGTSSGGGLMSRLNQETPAGIDWDALLASEQKQQQHGVYLHEFRRKQRLFWFRVGLVGAVVIGAFCGLYNFRKDTLTIETADVLTNHGRPEDAVKIFEKLKQNRGLTAEDSEKLNNAYVQSAIKLAKHKQFQEAVDMLQHVSPHSRYADQASTMLKKYRRRLASS
ncbi:MAG TPA: serine/threonine-protein kinase [Planktothrix sp.]|jgi:serine/threonine-protein kinase